MTYRPDSTQFIKKAILPIKNYVALINFQTIYAQQDDTGKLHLLDIVGGAGDQGSSAEILDLSVGKVDDRGEGLSAQLLIFLSSSIRFFLL